MATDNLPHTLPRQLVLLCDGTNNNLSGRHSDTHVVLMAELLRLFPDAQRLVYYDPGVGNPEQLPGTTVMDKIHRALDRIDGLAFGRGLYDNVAEGYRFLMSHWRPGDEIYIFGFSRGAFTARSIAGLVNAFGIIDKHQDTLVASLVSTYFAKTSPERSDITQQAARLFGQGLTPGAWPEVHFVGVWDTVASVGLPPFGLKITARPNLDGKHFRHVRQAMALDEQRAQFLPRAYEQDDGSFRLKNGATGDIQQCWFRGSHCDVGGGNEYPFSELSRAPFAWLVAEAIRCGLRVPMPVGHPGPVTEADVFAVMPQLDPPTPLRLAARINSQTHATPLWALTGLTVRDTASALVDGEPSRRVKMHAHPSVAEWKYAFPEQTAWRDRGDVAAWFKLLVGLMMVAAFMVLAGWAQLSPTSWLPALDRLGAIMDANLAFQAWQLSLAPMQEWLADAQVFERPKLALVFDLGLIAAWAWVLSLWTCRAFARHAGLIRVGSTPPAWLNRLGWALPVAVAADLLEDLFSGLSILALRVAPDALWLWVPRLAMTAASAVKWLALLSLAGLILSSFLRRHR
jgi:hypothetical protein